jgi:hypothetical protein
MTQQATVRNILPDLSNVQSPAELELEQLRAENARLKAGMAQGSGLKIKVSEKGGVSIYGLGRFPVTLYAGQWLRLLAIGDTIRAFIRDHDHELEHKS